MFRIFIITSHEHEIQLTLPPRKAEKLASPTITNSRKAEIPAWVWEPHAVGAQGWEG